jgi:hopanoid biosynthesis associated protein HpnK
MTRPASNRLILTADDFGLHPAVNEAVEQGHREGVLTAASLMVGGAAAAEAVRCARRNPRLRVGLHVVLADGAAILPAAQIPDLVDAQGRFGERMIRAGIRFYFDAEVRRQLEAEIRAQFAAYAAAEIPLDHVNCHKHFHLHPTVLGLILRIGREYGLKAVRLPLDRRAGYWLRPCLASLQRRLDRAGIVHNDQVIGLRSTGQLDEAALLAELDRLAPGVTEIYFHPGTRSGGLIAPTMKGYRHGDELAALLSPRVRAKLDALALPRGGFCDLAAP